MVVAFEKFILCMIDDVNKRVIIYFHIVRMLYLVENCDILLKIRFHLMLFLHKFEFVYYLIELCNK